jgi:hypothetical protein
VQPRPYLQINIAELIPQPRDLKAKALAALHRLQRPAPCGLLPRTPNLRCIAA